MSFGRSRFGYLVRGVDNVQFGAPQSRKHERVILPGESDAIVLRLQP